MMTKKASGTNPLGIHSLYSRTHSIQRRHHIHHPTPFQRPSFASKYRAVFSRGMLVWFSAYISYFIYRPSNGIIWAHLFRPQSRGMLRRVLNYHLCAQQDAVVQDIEDHIRQAQSIIWLASKYDEGRQSMRSASLSASSSYSSSPGQASQVRAHFSLYDSHSSRCKWVVGLPSSRHPLPFYRVYME